MHTLLLVLHVVISLILIGVVVLQSGRSYGLSGAIAGGAQAFFGKKKGIDDLLATVTRYLAVGFFATSLLLSILF
ncbi:MAG: preprotein translocase subunit SecG [Moorellales bacterium]